VRYVIGRDENTRNTQAHAHKTGLGQRASAGRHDCRVLIWNRTKERRRARNEPKTFDIAKLQPFEPLRFRVGVQVGSDFSNCLDAASPVRAADEIGNMQVVSLEPTIPRASDDGLGIDEDAVEVEQDCSKREGD